DRAHARRLRVLEEVLGGEAPGLHVVLLPPLPEWVVSGVVRPDVDVGVDQPHSGSPVGGGSVAGKPAVPAPLLYRRQGKREKAPVGVQKAGSSSGCCGAGPWTGRPLDAGGSGWGSISISPRRCSAASSRKARWTSSPSSSGRLSALCRKKAARSAKAPAERWRRSGRAGCPLLRCPSF